MWGRHSDQAAWQRSQPVGHSSPPSSPPLKKVRMTALPACHSAPCCPDIENFTEAGHTNCSIMPARLTTAYHATANKQTDANIRLPQQRGLPTEAFLSRRRLLAASRHECHVLGPLGVDALVQRHADGVLLSQRAVKDALHGAVRANLHGKQGSKKRPVSESANLH